MTFDEWWAENWPQWKYETTNKGIARAGWEAAQRAEALPRTLEALKPTDEELAAATELNKYLLAHEDDIAHGINDFSVLRPTFRSCIHREPSSSMNAHRSVFLTTR